MKKSLLLLSGLFLIGSAMAQTSFTNPAKKNRASVSHIPGQKVMTGTLTCSNYYVAGSTMDLHFTINMASPDAEFGDSLWMQFPSGFVINSATDPIGNPSIGQAAESLNTPIVSPVVTWGDNDNNIGGIEPGIVNFSVNVTIPAGTTGQLSFQWHLDGDEYGAAPNFVAGTGVIDPVPANPDVSLTGDMGNKYLQLPITIPFEFTLTADLYNNAATVNSATKVGATCSTLMYNDSTPVTIPFNTGASQSVTWTTKLQANALGSHNVYMHVPVPNDINPMDNYDTLSFIVTDSTYAYMDTVTNGNPVGFADGAEGIMGSVFEIPSNSDLSSIGFYVPSPDVTTQVTGVVYEVGPNGPNATPLFESLPQMVYGSGPTVNIIPIHAPLVAGKSYLIGVKKLMTGGLYLGQSPLNYYMNTQYAYFNGAWNELGGVGFPFSQGIYAHFSGATPSCQASYTDSMDVSDPMTYYFSDASYNPVGNPLTYSWDFGDGSTSTQENPMHTFGNEQDYDVCLTISDGANCSSTSCRTITVDDGVNSIDDLSAFMVNVYPNPASSKVNIEVEYKTYFEIVSVDGRVLKSGELQPGNNSVVTDNLSDGMYFVRLTQNNNTVIRTLSVAR